MPKTQAVNYRDARGVEPVELFIDALPPKRAAKIDACIEEHVNGRPPDAPPPDYPVTTQIDGELRELRIRFADTATGSSTSVPATSSFSCTRSRSAVGLCRRATSRWPSGGWPTSPAG